MTEHPDTRMSSASAPADLRSKGTAKATEESSLRDG